MQVTPSAGLPGEAYSLAVHAVVVYRALDTSHGGIVEQKDIVVGALEVLLERGLLSAALSASTHGDDAGGYLRACRGGNDGYSVTDTGYLTVHHYGDRRVGTAPAHYGGVLGSDGSYQSSRTAYCQLQCGLTERDGLYNRRLRRIVALAGKHARHG